LIQVDCDKSHISIVIPRATTKKKKKKKTVQRNILKNTVIKSR